MKVARRLFVITFTLVVMLEMGLYPGDPLSGLGWYLQQDIKTWSPIPIAFSLVELALIATALIWLFSDSRAKREHHYEPGRLVAPLVALGVALAIGVAWGLTRGGDNLTFALFEVRGFGVLIFAYVLVGMLLHNEHDLSLLIWCILIACAGLAIEDTLRYFFFLGPAGVGDLSFEHDDSIVLGFGAVLCLALQGFGGTCAQRRLSVALFPFVVVCLALLHRRAAWPVLGVGLVVLAIILYRLRPKVFWRVVPLAGLVIALYLVATWNDQGVAGQPARALRSQFSPDPRDAGSDYYRLVERYNILANVASSRLLGLGFGQQFTFYYPLPDLSFWPFWHYETHNSILWLWMDGGIPVFFSFCWLGGSALYVGGQELASHREAWSLAQLRLRGRSRRERRRAREGSPTGSLVRRQARNPHEARAESDATGRSSSRSVRLKRRASTPRFGQYGGPTALAAAAICLIPMQFIYSYVDLGLVSGRDMLLLGVMLGIVGRSFTSQPPHERHKRKRGGNDASVSSLPSREPATDMSPELIPVGRD